MRSQLWPPLNNSQTSAEPRSRRVAHNAFFQEAVTDLQRWVDQLKLNNANVFAFCSTYYECGKTLFEAPGGVITRIFTIIDKGDIDDWCTKVHYSSAKFKEVEARAKAGFENLIINPNTGAHIQQGVRKADASTDSTCGRARNGLWAIYRRRIYLAPWIQSNEKVVVEWDGIKDSWEDGDLLNEDYWGATVREAIKSYVQWRIALSPWGCKELAPTYERDYANKLADLIWEHKKRTEQQTEDGPELNRLPTSDELAAEAETVQTVEADSEAVTALDGSEVTLTWTEPNVEFDASTARYHVLRNDVLIADLATSELSFVDTEIVSGQTYTYSVILNY